MPSRRPRYACVCASDEALADGETAGADGCGMVAVRAVEGDALEPACEPLEQPLTTVASATTTTVARMVVAFTSSPVPACASCRISSPILPCLRSILQSARHPHLSPRRCGPPLKNDRSGDTPRCDRRTTRNGAPDTQSEAPL